MSRAAGKAAEQVARFVVTAGNFSCQGGTFTRGDYVYGTWVEGSAGAARLVQMGLLGPAGEVDASDVPKAPGLQAPYEAVVPAGVPEYPSIPPSAWEAIAALSAAEEQRAASDGERDEVVAKSVVDVPRKVSDVKALRAKVQQDWSVPVVLAYAAKHPDQLQAITKAEKLGKGRATLLAGLERLAD